MTTTNETILKDDVKSLTDVSYDSQSAADIRYEGDILFSVMKKDYAPAVSENSGDYVLKEVQ